ncbi:MAG: type II secretion system F family protein [Erysipelotrichaceae bacterium]|nr:type II secretion system F family protein [Erysipelotrichaceae bacterium]
MGKLKKLINVLNQPIGASPNGTDKKSVAKREKNLQLKVMELTPQDAIKNTKNIRYKYKVRDKSGNITEGKLDALSKVDVHSFLMNQGYDVLNIEEDEMFNKLGLVQLTTRQMSDKNLTFFLTQLSTYIKAGIPLVDSINILAKQAKDKKTKNLYNRLVFELTTGQTLSEALNKQGTVFPRLLINMVKTSELTGNLTGVLDDMADYYKTSDENRKQIISAMTYPAVIFILAIVVLVYIILYVVPEFTDMYSQIGSELPTITKVIVSLSDFLAANIIYVILVMVAIFTILTILYKNVTSFRTAVQWLTMHIPVVKNIIIYKEIIMFTKTFASLINYDVFITDSMEILGKITNNEIYKMLIRDAVVNLSNGNGVSLAFKDHWAFPPIAYEMLLTGERTGRLGTMMGKVADYYNVEQKNLVTQLKSLIEPIMIIFLAVMVGIVLLAVVVPMFSMYDDIM